jgi:hypothetical protein
MIFEESGLLFTFSDAWDVRAFDDHRYYRWLSGRGLRGVDFIGLHQGKLVLIEVKNFRRREGMSTTDAFQAVREDPASFAMKLVGKVNGSLEIVQAVNDAHRRRWWFPLFLRLPDPWKQRFPQRYFWYVTSELALDPANCTFVLWLDADSDTSGAEETIMHLLHQNLTEKIRHIILAGRNRTSSISEVGAKEIWKD